MRLYRNKAPIEGANVRNTRFTFERLVWNEFKMVFKGDFTFFKHFARQLLPNQKMCVKLYGIGSPGTGKYNDLTIYAYNTQTLAIADSTLRPGEYGGYSSKYLMYDRDGVTELSFDNMITTMNDKVKKYDLSFGRILSKAVNRTEGGGATVYYLKFASKKKNKNFK